MAFRHVAFADCKFCHGTGEVIDSVPYGNSYSNWSNICEACVSRVIEEHDLEEDSCVLLVPIRRLDR